MPDPRSRRRSLALAAGCAAVVALLAATPLAWFALSDAALLDRPAAMDQPYTSLVPTGEDYYLIRQLKAQNAAFLSVYGSRYATPAAEGTAAGEDPLLYTASGQNQGEMIWDAWTMYEYLNTLLDQLYTAGVLDDIWCSVGKTLLEHNGERVYYSNDSLGFTRISVFPEENEYNPCLMVVVESRTNKLVTLWMDFGTEYGRPGTPPDPAVCLPAWTRFNELDGLGDWAPPAGTDFEESGLYSARGGVLMTCAAGNAWGDTERTWLCLHLGVREEF